MIYQPVRRAINDARQKIKIARDQASETQPTMLHDAFDTLRLAVDDLADAVEALYEAAALEEQSR